MAQETKLQAAGLYTNPSDLQRPEGALTVADNVIVKREGVIEPRRGFRKFADSTGPSGSDPFFIAAAYDRTIVTANNDGYIGHLNVGLNDNSGTLTTESVNWTEAAYTWSVANGNLYIPTDYGVYKKTSYNASPILAGSPKGPGLDLDSRVATAAIGQMSLTSNVVTVNTSAAHGFYVGQIVAQTSATEAPYAKGNYVVLTVPSSTSFTYALTAGNDAGNANAHTFQPAQLNTTNGWLEDGYQVAYRYVFNSPDANCSEIVSAPSPRCTVSNTSSSVGYVAATKANPILRLFVRSWFTLAQESTVTVRVYRSKQTPVGVEPSDEMGLIAERILTRSEYSRNVFDIVDITPDAMRGEALYTNPSQEGIEQSNDLPPEIESPACSVFDGQRLLISGNTRQPHRLLVSLLAVGGANGIQNNDVLNLGVSGIKGVTGTPATAAEFKIETSGSDAQNIRNTALNLCAAINRDHSDAYAYYVSNANDAPGQILVVSNLPAGAGNFRAESSGKRDAFYPVLGAASATFSCTRSGSTVTATIGSGVHNFKAGESITIGNPSVNFPEGPFTILTVTTTTLTFTSSGSAVTENRNIYSTQAPTSDNDAQFARVYESKPFQPDAFPLLNYADIGDTTKRVWAMAVVRNAVFAFKEDGLFIRTAPLTWELFDGTVKLVSFRSVSTLLNNIYAWTTQGVVAINDTGVEIISRPIEKTLTDAFNSFSSAAKEYGFGVANEVDRTYHLYAPGTASFSRQCFTYNAITRAWTRETIGNLEFASGIVATDEYNKLHRAVFTVDGKLLMQRNKNVKEDYQDVSGTFYTPDSKVAAYLTYNAAPGFAAGDFIVSDTGNIHQITLVSNTLYYVTPNVVLTDTSYALCTAISTSWQYAPITAGNPDLLKMFRQANVLFQNAHAQTMALEFSTELRTTPESQTVDLQTIVGQWGTTWDGIERPFNLSTLIPQEMRRATRLNIKATINRPLQVFAVNGLSLRFTASGDKVSK